MEDHKKLSVRALRDLARQKLGSGEARLKTRDDLLKALKGAVVGTLEKAGVSAEKADAVSEGAKKMASSIKKRVTGKGNGHEKGEPETAGLHAPPGSVPRPGEEKPARQVRSSTRSRGEKEPAVEAQKSAEPVVEGFFVARVAGEDEARRHHLTEEQAPPVQEARGTPPYDEHLGELPDHYDDDAVLLLPRDPHTLFFLWDFKNETRHSALEGIPNPRAVLKVFDNGHLVRELDFALESKSYYLHDLTPGRYYRVEAHFVGSDGQSRRLGLASNVIALPSEGPSSNTEVRFMRVPWGLPLSRLKEFLRDGRARIGAYLGERKFLETPAVQNPSSDTLQQLFSPGERSWTSPRSGRNR